MLPLLLGLTALLSSDRRSDPPRAIVAQRLSDPVVIDGHGDEAAWRNITPITALVQTSPDEGAPASEESDIRIAYDASAMYVSARMKDRAPDSVLALMSRRDGSNQSDFFGLYLDPLGDHRNGYFFQVSAAGVQSDGTLYNDDFSDGAWDAVWDAETRRTADGWEVEMRIPFSQLRMKSEGAQHWGINIARGIGRRDEVAYYVARPRQGSGFVSHFAELDGLEGVTPKRRMELVPYATARSEFTRATPGNPFNDGSRTTPSIGADFRVGLGRGFQLDGTINPDFGQVEVDPAVVNLGDVETFFEEKRPFFVEGGDLFRFGYGGANNFSGFSWVNVDPVYSRRIGRAPQGFVPTAEFADIPRGTPILGAGKLTGAIGGWKVGALTALTGREYARLATVDGVESRAEVEPLAGYGILRAQRTMGEGRHGFGVLATGMQRDFRDGALRDQLDAGAVVGGIDGWVTLDRGRRWVMSGWGAASHVTGSAARIDALQRGPTHYFQRPDAEHLDYDPAATALDGSYGRLTLNKQQGATIFNAAVGAVSPGFDDNDVGFTGRTDVLNAHVLSGYRWTTPGSWYRTVRLQAATWVATDFGGTLASTGVWNHNQIQWKNYTTSVLGFSWGPRTTDVRATRGGPAIDSPAGYEVFSYWGSDFRKKWTLEVEGGFSGLQGADGSGDYLTVTSSWRPSDRVTLSAGPAYNASHNAAQYLRSTPDPLAGHTFGRRYLFGDLHQQTVSANLRVDWIFTPRMSLELFAQPLVSTGDYRAIRELVRPNSYQFRNYGDDGSTVDRAAGTVDPDGAGPAPAIAIGQPDFTTTSLRGNAVFRWEYRPGSTVFLVWTQQRGLDTHSTTFSPGHSLSDLLGAPGDNVLMLKLSYRIAS